MSQTDRQTNGGQTEPCQQMAGVCDSDSFAPHGYVTHTSDTRSTGDARHFLPRSSSASWLRRAVRHTGINEGVDRQSDVQARLLRAVRVIPTDTAH